MKKNCDFCVHRYVCKTCKNYEEDYNIDEFAEWLKSQTVSVNSENSTILVAVKEGDDMVWRNAIAVFKTTVSAAS